MGEHWSHHLDPHTKRCSGCKEIKPLIEFSVNAARYDGLVNYCHACRLAQGAERRRKQRQDLINEFGGQCVRCGFSDWRALQFDHVNNDGSVDRRDKNGHNQTRLARLVRANPERFQLLCANCNQIKRYEQQECPGRSDQTRGTLDVRTFTPRAPSTRSSYSPRRTLEAEARGEALAKLVSERRPLERHAERLPVGSWSRHYERCLGCHETDRSHASDGCCYRCDKVIKGYNRRVSVFGQVPAVE